MTLWLKLKQQLITLKLQNGLKCIMLKVSLEKERIVIWFCSSPKISTALQSFPAKCLLLWFNLRVLISIVFSKQALINHEKSNKLQYTNSQQPELMVMIQDVNVVFIECSTNCVLPSGQKSITTGLMTIQEQYIASRIGHTNVYEK